MRTIGEKIVSAISGVGKTGKPSVFPTPLTEAEEWTGPHFTPLTKINLKWIKDLKV